MNLEIVISDQVHREKCPLHWTVLQTYYMIRRAFSLRGGRLELDGVCILEDEVKRLKELKKGDLVFVGFEIIPEDGDKSY